MKQIVKGAVIGAICGVAAPVGLAVANEVLFAHNKYNDITAARICFAERTWSLFRLDIKYAKGCKNGLLDSVPLCLVVGVLGGSLIGALSLVSKNTAQKTPDQPAPPAVAPQEPVAASLPEQTLIPLQRVQQDALKPQEPVASKPPLIEPLIKKIPKEFDLNFILRMSAVGGALALGGFVAIKVLQNSPDPASTGGEGVGSSSGFNPFRQRTQQQYYLLESYSDAYYKNSYGRNPVNSTLEEKMTREEVCTSAKENVITQFGLGDILANGGKVISQGSQIKIIVKSPYDFVLLGRSRILVDCFYTPYIIER